MYTKKEIWKISYPILISLVVQNLINITDTAYLGHVGEIELGASALAGVFYMAIYSGSVSVLKFLSADVTERNVMKVSER